MNSDTMRTLVGITLTPRTPQTAKHIQHLIGVDDAHVRILDLIPNTVRKSHYIE